MCVCVCVCVCVYACMRANVRACMCVRVCVCTGVSNLCEVVWYLSCLIHKSCGLSCMC